MMDATKEIGLKLLIARRRLGATQREIGMAAGVSAAVVAQLERGRRLPSLPVLERLAAAVKVPLSALLDVYRELESQS